MVYILWILLYSVKVTKGNSYLSTTMQSEIHRNKKKGNRSCLVKLKRMINLTTSRKKGKINDMHTKLMPIKRIVMVENPSPFAFKSNSNLRETHNKLRITRAYGTRPTE